MIKKSRLFLFASLLPVSMMLGAAGAAQAHEGHAHDAANSTPVPATQSLWSNPASWPDKKVPREGDEVTIGRDMNIVLDVNPPALRSLTIDGKLSFSDNLDLELASDWIYLRRGELQIGEEGKPHTRKATITLTDKVPGEDINTMGDRGIIMMGGTLSLHGDRENSWTKLAKTAQAGSAQIEVLNASGWRRGDEIVLASTDFDPRQAEKRVITAINGNVLTLDTPLQYMHFGEITFGVDQRGEVGMLTRNIRIQASEDAEGSYFGGHIMAMAGSKMYVSGVELNRMGQNMHLARYPIHWHIVGEGQGQYIRNSSIHDTYSRCVTLHGTNNVLVENNVTYNNIGHCFFLEDAVETGNQIVRNLGILTKCHPTNPCNPTNAYNFSADGQKAKDVLIPSDNTAATFWITNPDNVFRDNVAAGSEQIGFWIALPEHPTGAFEGTETAANTWPRRVQLREFSGNVAHSNFDGLMFDRGPAADGSFNVAGNTHMAYADPSSTSSEKLISVINDFTGYKNHAAIWGRGENHVFSDLKLSDNAIGYTHAYPGLAPGGGAFTSRVENSLFVGESANVGNPRTEAEIAAGRSLPSKYSDFPIRGYEYYDFGQELVNVTFRNFQDNNTREAGAISYLLFSNFPISTENSVERLTFDNAKPVHYPKIDARWAFEIGDEIGYTGAAFVDKDGSLGGAPGSYVVIDNGIASDNASCDVKPTWNAAICEGDFGRLSLRATDGKPVTGGMFARATGGSPIKLVRNGREFVAGAGTGFFGNGVGNTTIPSGAEVKAETESEVLDIGLTEMEDGSWVIFELPGFKTANTGARSGSIAALRAANETSYYSAGNSLWVKLVANSSNVSRNGGPPGMGGGNTIQVRR
ncbi:MAG TPA: G8 domain-containing protein [Croceibacterium sp.]|nr:G8 domain-containing protein [Croceibacterium sp.]